MLLGGYEASRNLYWETGRHFSVQEIQFLTSRAHSEPGSVSPPCFDALTSSLQWHEVEQKTQSGSRWGPLDTLRRKSHMALHPISTLFHYTL
ncbi:hypothetical protein CDAR_221071 [Caerostris darwini]|uniref:Uncharacterized protein n=1 Tax=Caerostris darwini TaxID=1538125 RepID=A0AAV4R4P7_9ARAC|nr:hypothetical protein CDAR_221071 [Caerostris darwini]